MKPYLTNYKRMSSKKTSDDNRIEKYDQNEKQEKQDDILSHSQSTKFTKSNKAQQV